MESEGIRPIEDEKPPILVEINAAMAKLGLAVRWRRAPDFLPEYGPLKGKRIAMVDDSKGVLSAFVPELTVATGGNASFVAYDEQPLEDLVREIMEGSPEAVLLDYNLSRSLKGPEVAQALIDRAYAGTIIGFSSDPAADKDFEDAGVSICVQKDPGDATVSIKALGGRFS